MTHREDWEPGTCREAVWYRQGGLCALCWEPMGGVESNWEAHHRLRRRDLPGWCPCNIVGLHARCHTQGAQAVHDHPAEAHDLALVLHPEQDPRDEPVEVLYPWVGKGYLDCDGMVVSPLVAHPLASSRQERLPFE